MEQVLHTNIVQHMFHVVMETRMEIIRYPRLLNHPRPRHLHRHYHLHRRHHHRRQIVVHR